ncbi:uncharacterized protein LOC134815265 [Bolinopsis microptera]|uniref:uncharacterized protein LOC134815265 n=1 Tax=Bolinopsis microptera TaxID=2820187 RepID=UPI0030792AE6
MGRKIEELDSETQELLAASVTIPSLSILVQELVYNSIDSGATCIAVRINVDRSSRVQIVDNGCGVQNVVDLCEHPPTNKRKISRKLYGTRRGSLYSIVKLCERVSVTTRRHNSTITKTFSSYDKPKVVTEKRNRHSIGTTITIDNVFNNMPVRSACVSYMDLEQTKDTLLKVAVANPSVAITLKDIHSGTKLFQTQSSSAYSDNFMIYCHHAIDWERLSQVKFDVNGYKLTALLSNELHHKPRQLVYINRHHIEDERIRKFANDILTSALGSKDRKNQENRFPVFLFLITCKPIKVDMCFESNTFCEFHDWDSVFTLVYRCIASFLEAEQIPLDVTDEELARLKTPCLSLQSMLRVASPNINIKSDKALRPSKYRSLAPPDSMFPRQNDNEANDSATDDPSPRKLIKETVLLETPKKTNHPKFVPKKTRLINDVNFSPHNERNPKPWNLKTPEKLNSEDKDQIFNTPTSWITGSTLSYLHNSPALEHLQKDNEKRAARVIKSSKTVEKSHPLEKYLKTENCRRRSSTPLRPLKPAVLQLTISPIGQPQRIRDAPSPSVQTKRKRSYQSTSYSVSKKQVTKTDHIIEMKTERSRFHFETPRFILDGQNHSSSHMQTKGANLFGEMKDSGYQTPLGFESIDLKKSSEQPFDVFEDEEEKFVMDESSVRDSFDPKPRFKVYSDDSKAPTNDDEETNHDSALTGENSVLHFSQVSQEKQTAEDDPKTLTKGSEENQRVRVMIVGHSKVETACSPIKITVDRGCSPVNFTQLNILSACKESVPHQAVEIAEEIVQSRPKVNSSSEIQNNQSYQSSTDRGSFQSEDGSIEQSCSFDSFGDMNGSLNMDGSLLSDVEREIDELTKSRDLSAYSQENCPIKSPCLECHSISTHTVMKRLDFASQVLHKPDHADKENIQPEFHVIAPVTAASHLVADYSPWNKEGPKMTVHKRPQPLDVRKWKSDVFTTHGEGSWRIQTDSKVNRKFLLDATKFDKSVFDGIQVIGQIDEKFIGCVSSEGMLILVDQHAAHERVRLECMLDTVHKNCKATKEVELKRLCNHIPIKISKADGEFIIRISSKLRHVGFEFDAGKFQFLITAIPAFCFSESNHLNISVEDIVTSFHQTVQQIKESKGSNLALPALLVDYLHSKACHGAIRFGNELTPQQCIVLIKQLSVCDLPFQCAHGRPSFAPIIKLKDEQLAKFKGLRLDVDPICQELSFLKLRSRCQTSL